MKVPGRTFRLFVSPRLSFLDLVGGRVKILWVVSVAVLSLSLRTFSCLMLLFGSTLLYGFLAGVVRQHLIVLKYAALLAVPAVVLMFFVTGDLSGVEGIAFRVFARLVVMSSAGVLFALSTSPRELVRSLGWMRVPTVVLFPLTTALRFIPSLLRDLEEVRDALRLRGVNPGLYFAVRHPLWFFRIILVPLTVRSVSIADNLAAAAESRGMGSPAGGSVFPERRDVKYELLGLGAVVVFSVFLICMDRRLGM